MDLRDWVGDWVCVAKVTHGPTFLNDMGRGA